MPDYIRPAFYKRMNGAIIGYRICLHSTYNEHIVFEKTKLFYIRKLVNCIFRKVGILFYIQNQTKLMLFYVSFIVKLCATFWLRQWIDKLIVFLPANDNESNNFQTHIAPKIDSFWATNTKFTEFFVMTKILTTIQYSMIWSDFADDRNPIKSCACVHMFVCVNNIVRKNLLKTFSNIFYVSRENPTEVHAAQIYFTSHFKMIIFEIGVFIMPAVNICSIFDIQYTMAHMHTYTLSLQRALTQSRCQHIIYSIDGSQLYGVKKIDDKAQTNNWQKWLISA